MKIEFSSQRREMLLFLTTNMAAVTSLANQQLSQFVPKIVTSTAIETRSSQSIKIGKSDLIDFDCIDQTVEIDDTLVSLIHLS